MKWKITILVVFLLVSVGVGQVLAQEAEKVKFQINLKPNDTFKVLRKVDVNMDMMTFSQVMTFTMWTDLEVLDRKQGSELASYQIQETITRVKVDASGDMGKEFYKISCDSAEEESDTTEKEDQDKNQKSRTMEKQMKMQMKGLVNQRIKYEVSDRGKVISWSAKLERGMQEILVGGEIFAGMSAPLPEEASLGFVWQQPFNPEAAQAWSLPIDSSTFTCTCTSTLKEVKQQLAIIESKLDFQKKTKDKEKDMAKEEEDEISEILGEEKVEEEMSFSMEASMQSIEGEGPLVFDLNRGLPVEHTNRVKIDMDMGGNKWVIETISQTKIK